MVRLPLAAWNSPQGYDSPRHPFAVMSSLLLALACCRMAADAGAAPTGRPWTLSFAVAASCVENAQNLELATLLAGQIARAAAIFNVDEASRAGTAGVSCCRARWPLPRGESAGVRGERCDPGAGDDAGREISGAVAIIEC